MLPFVYNGDGGDSDDYNSDRRNRNRSRSRSYSRSRSRSRSRTRSSARSPRRDRRYRSSRWSRSSSSERDHRNRSRSPREDSERDSRRTRDRRLSAQSRGSSQYDRAGEGSHSSFGQPHYKIVMKMLPHDISREAIMSIVTRQGFRAKDIRIVHRGADRCFGFIEFPDVNSAQAWMEFNKGTLTLDDSSIVKMEYSRYDSLDGRPENSISSSDWMCAMCTVKNFKNRGSCFKCNTTRVQSDGLTRRGFAAVGVVKCDTLLIREIPPNCAESVIERELLRVVAISPLRVHVAGSGQYAYVQMQNADDAERAMAICSQVPLLINGSSVVVTFSRLPLSTVLSTSIATESIQKATEHVNQLAAFKPTAGPAGNTGAEAAQLAIAKAALIRHMTESMMAEEIYNTPPPPIVVNRQPVQQETNFVVTDYFKEEPPNSNFVCVEDVAAAAPLGIAGPVSTSTATPLAYVAPTLAGNVTVGLGMVQTPWGLFNKFLPPNPTLYQYDESSGLYYDPSTALYYDSNSQYYWDGSVGQWKVWNGTYGTYIPCDSMAQATAEKASVVKTEAVIEVKKEDVVPAATTADAPPNTEPEKKPEKRAKDIAREMARWAKKQSRVQMSVRAPPRLATVSPLSAPASRPKQANEPTADITFKMLEKARNPLGSMSDEEEEEDLPLPPRIGATGICRSALNSVPPANRSAPGPSHLPPPAVVDPIVIPSLKPAQMSESFVDLEKKFCILCKRKFVSLEVLMKHVRLSDLHKKNLEAHLLQSSVSEAPSTSALSEGSANFGPPSNARPQYRDRAKERRNMFGLDPSGFAVDSVDAEAADYSVRSQDVPIDETNIGNKLLKSMGWTEGTGIGKNNQGIVVPITAERRVEGAGLGAAGSRVLHGANASRRERARFATMSRYQELN